MTDQFLTNVMVIWSTRSIQWLILHCNWMNSGLFKCEGYVKAPTAVLVPKLSPHVPRVWSMMGLNITEWAFADCRCTHGLPSPAAGTD